MSGGSSSNAIHERVGEGGSNYDPIKYPEISGVSPVIASHTGGTIIYLSGKFFYKNVTSVYIGEEICDSVKVISLTSLRCITPAAPNGLGIYDIKVINDSSKKVDILKDSFEYRAANFPAHIFMAQGTQYGDDFTTQTGSNFHTGDNIIIEKIVEGI